MQRSVIIRPGSHSSRRSKASSPVFAVTTFHPSLARTRRKLSRTAGSSSIKRIGGIIRSPASGAKPLGKAAGTGGTTIAGVERGRLILFWRIRVMRGKAALGWPAVGGEFAVHRSVGGKARLAKFIPRGGVEYKVLKFDLKPGRLKRQMRKMRRPTPNFARSVNPAPGYN